MDQSKTIWLIVIAFTSLLIGCSREQLLPMSETMELKLNDAHFDIDEDCTYFISPTGDDTQAGTEREAPFQHINHAAQIAKAGETICVEAGMYKEQVVPAHSGNEEAGYITYLALEPNEVMLDGDYQFPDRGVHWHDGLFFVSNKSYLIIEGFIVKNSLAAGIYVGDGSHNIIIRNNSTDATWSSGIGVWHSDSIEVYSNEIQQANYGDHHFDDGRVAKEQEMLTIAATTNFDVHHNYVHNGVILEPEMIGGAEGIDVKEGSQFGKVHHNRIEGLPDNLGIYIDTYGPTAHIEVYNNFIDCTHPMTNGIQGIVLASETSHPLRNIDVYNNIIINCVYDGILVADWSTGDITNINIVHNTVLNNGREDFGWGGGISVQTDLARQVYIGNNIISDNGNWQLFLIESDAITASHNLINGPNDYIDGALETALGENPIVAPPKFIDGAQQNFRLAADSPGVAVGNEDLPIQVLFDFYDRPRGSAVDVGALISE